MLVGKIGCIVLNLIIKFGIQTPQAKVLKPSETIKQIGGYVVIPLGEGLTKITGYTIFKTAAEVGVEISAFSVSPVSWGIGKGLNWLFTKVADQSTTYFLKINPQEKVPAWKKEMQAMAQVIAREGAGQAAQRISKIERVQATEEKVRNKSDAIVNAIKVGTKFDKVEAAVKSKVDQSLKKVGINPEIPLSLRKKEIALEQRLIDKQNKIQQGLDQLTQYEQERPKIESEIQRLKNELNEHEKNLQNALRSKVMSGHHVREAHKKIQETKSKIQQAQQRKTELDQQHGRLTQENRVQNEEYLKQKKEFLSLVYDIQQEKFLTEEQLRSEKWRQSRSQQFQIPVVNTQFSLSRENLEKILNEYLKDIGDPSPDKHTQVRIIGEATIKTNGDGSFIVNIPLEITSNEKVIGAGKITSFKTDFSIIMSLDNDGDFPSAAIDAGRFHLKSKPRLKVGGAKIARVSGKVQKELDKQLPKIQADIQSQLDKAFNKEAVVRLLYQNLPQNVNADNINIKVKAKFENGNLNFQVELDGNFHTKLSYATLTALQEPITLPMGVNISKFDNIKFSNGKIIFDVALSGKINEICRFEAVPYYDHNHDTIGIKEFQLYRTSPTVYKLLEPLINNGTINSLVCESLFYKNVQQTFRARLADQIDKSQGKYQFKLDTESAKLYNVNFTEAGIALDFNISSRKSLDTQQKSVVANFFSYFKLPALFSRGSVEVKEYSYSMEKNCVR